MRTLDEIDVSDTIVGLRVDLNSPIAGDGSIRDDARFRAHLPTIEELLQRDARLALLAHQGRPGGDDFTSLEVHAAHLNELIDPPVRFVDSTFASAARTAITELRTGEAVVLENTRFYSEEYMEFDPDRAGETHLVARLSEVFEVFVNDAFAVAHRSQPSVVGFPQHLPSYAGRVMERELEVLSDLRTTPEPRMAVLAGAKLAGAIDVLERFLDERVVDEVAVGGLLANLFFVAGGFDPGSSTVNDLTDRGYADEVDRAANLLDRFSDAIVLPEDVAVDVSDDRSIVTVEEFPIDAVPRDIGDATAAAWADRIAESETVICNGPLGLVEDPRFVHGTDAVFSAMASADMAIAGGGDTAASIRTLGIEGFDHVSTGGGAAMTLLSGRELPGVTALRACTVAPPT